jgi:hypothetical protein
MPYVLENLVEGREPSVRAVGDASDAPEGSYVVEEAPPADHIWDATARQMRARTQAESLSYAKAAKEAGLRDAADRWYRQNVRAFEGAVVVHKIDRGFALNAEEQAIRNAMNANYTKLKNLIGQVRAAATVAEVEAISWT